VEERSAALALWWVRKNVVRWVASSRPG